MREATLASIPFWKNHARPMSKKLARITALLTMVLYAWMTPLQASADLPLPGGSLVVRVTSPTSGSTITGTVPINATVSVVGALTVAGVQFKSDGVNIGAEDRVAPYSVPWITTTTANGAHNLTAVARDSLGGLYTSDPVTVTVDNDVTPPTVSIGSPVSGATVAGTIAITVSAADDRAVTGVQFFVDGVAGTDVTAAPYTAPWNTTTATNGSHTLTAVARDAAGNRTTSAPVTVTVSNDTTPPTVSINQATAQTDPTGASPITFTAVFSEPVSGFSAADVSVGGTAGGSKSATVSGGPSTYTVAVSGMTTSGTVTASIAAGAAQDAAGNTSTAPTSTDNSVSFDATAPTVSISSPAAGTTVSGTITVTVNAADDTAVTGVQFFVDGNAGTDDTAAPYSMPWNTTTMSNGSHSLTAVARDAAGNRTTSAPVTVTVANDGTAPTVSINQAAAQADPTAASPITFAAIFSEPVSGFSATDVIVGGTAGGSKTATISGGPTSYTVAVSGMTTSGTVTVSIAAGAAQDAAGNASSASTSADNQVAFDATAPSPPSTPDLAVASDSGASGTDNVTNVKTPTFTGTAEAGSTVKIFSDGVPVGTGTATAGAYSIISVSLSDGTHSIAATATDATNNVSSLSGALNVTIDTTAPTVAVTSPESGATVSGTITVTTSPADDVGVVGVQFFLDGNAGTDATTAPYSASWNTNTTTNGSHTVTAVARDAAGNLTTSAPVTITVANDSTAPTVSISSPVSGDTVFGTITVTVNAADDIAVTGVQYFLDGVAGTDVTTAPYSAPWNTRTTTNGSHTLTAVARDAAGNRTTSAPVTVTVANDSSVPTVSINQAADQADPTGLSPITFTAVFSEAVSGFSADDVAIGGTAGGSKSATVSGGPTTYTVAVTGMTASGTVTASIAAGAAQDEAGNTSSASTSTDNSVSFDAAAPTVSISSPASGDTVSGTITVTASAADDTAVAGVQFFLDGVGGTDVTTAPYSVPWNTSTASNGSHTITAVARDAAGNLTTSAPVTITVANDSTPPTVSITSPTTGDTVSGTISVTVSTADDTAVTGVQFFLDGSPGTDVTSAPFTTPWNTTTTTNGSHTLTAVARDAAGNRTTSAPVTVTVANDTTPPTVTITSPASGSTVSGTITVTVSTADDTAVTGVQFFLDGVGGTDVTTAPYSASWNTTMTSNGSHTLTAVARDAAGNRTTSAPVTVTVANHGTTRFEETSPAISAGPAGAWVIRRAEIATFSGGQAGSSNVTGATATLTFTGTAVTWVGLRCNVCGIASVSIDGGPAISVNTAGPAAVGSPGLTSEIVFTATDLAPGSHRLVITVTGTTTSGGAHIIVDAFDVTS